MSEKTKVDTLKEKPFYHDKSDAGKGDKPRSVSKQYRDNYDDIKGFKKSKYK